uniref:Ninjurin-1 n=1 Tax=Melanaphis sacchari TaxID=742174 RepID=A0A2H8THH4_9HEMI
MPACPPSHYSTEQQVLKDRDQVYTNNNSETTEQKLKHAAAQTPNRSTDIKTQQIEMNEIVTTNRSSTVDFSTDHTDTNGAEMGLVNNQNDKELPADDDSLLPNQTVIANEVIGNIDDDTPRAFNIYRNKKLLSHGMMDVALFSANANQLRYVLENSDGSALFIICIVLLLISIFLQILVGVALLLSARYNVTNCDQRRMAFKLGNYVIVGIFLITVVNIFITSFGGPAVISPAVVLSTSVTVTEYPDVLL